MPLKDPLCGMTVTPQSFHHLEQDGQTHYFCGPQCKVRFADHGATYSGGDMHAYPATRPPWGAGLGLTWLALALALALALYLVLRGHFF
jgi:YHS domain-containing protein